MLILGEKLRKRCSFARNVRRAMPSIVGVRIRNMAIRIVLLVIDMLDVFV